MYLGIRDALFVRLVGKPIGDVSRWFSGGAGLQAPTTPARTTIGSMVAPNTPKSVLSQVAVFPYDVAGRDPGIWPSVSAYFHQRVPRRDASYIFKDDVVAGVPGTRLRATFSDGSTRDGFGLKKRWPYGEPFDYNWRLRIWARDETELLLVEERLVDVVGTRGYLTIQLRNGTSTNIDTELEVPGVPVEVPPGLLQEGDQGEFSKIFTLRCEGYRDTTENVTLHRTVRERVLEIGENTTDAPVDTLELDSVESL